MLLHRTLRLRRDRSTLQKGKLRLVNSRQVAPLVSMSRRNMELLLQGGRRDMYYQNPCVPCTKKTYWMTHSPGKEGCGKVPADQERQQPLDDNCTAVTGPWPWILLNRMMIHCTDIPPPDAVHGNQWLIVATRICRNYQLHLNVSNADWASRKVLIFWEDQQRSVTISVVRTHRHPIKPKCSFVGIHTTFDFVILLMVVPTNEYWGSLGSRCVYTKKVTGSCISKRFCCF